jgi:hypothetical protein
MPETLDRAAYAFIVRSMTGETPKDPFTAFRDMVTQWETTANEWGNKMMSTPEAVQAMQMGTATTLKVKEATADAMAKALAAAHMPSKADVEAIGERLVAVEAQLARIEALLTGRADTVASVPVPRPKRTKTPPAKAAAKAK